MRVSSETEVAGSDGSPGWIHVIGETDPLEPVREYKVPQRVDISSLYASYANKSKNVDVSPLAARWGLEGSTVASMGIVWIGAHQAYGIPMYDSCGKVIGIQLRTTESKWTITGSKLGIFCSWPILSNRVFVCEGASDTAAMKSLGYEAVGRASCNSGGPLLKEMLKDKDVVIVSDNDSPQLMPNGKYVTPGQDGAVQLSYLLERSANSVKIILPPKPHKDIRQYITAGANRKHIEALCSEAYQR
jgi:hypothetical protein